MYKHWKHMLQPRRDTGAMIGAGLLGALAGAALAYWLYATESGSEKRTTLGRVGKTLKKHARDLKDDISDTMNDAKDAMDDLDEDEDDDEEE